MENGYKEFLKKQEEVQDKINAILTEKYGNSTPAKYGHLLGVLSVIVATNKIDHHLIDEVLKPVTKK